VLGRGRHRRSFTPMLSNLKTEVCRALFAHSDELLAAGNGAPLRLPLFRPAPTSLLPLWSNPSRPFQIQRPWITNTPSRVVLLKSPSALDKLCLQSLVGIQIRITFLIYFKLKMSLIYLQICHCTVLLIKSPF
jgi:hypothetical protein